MQSIKDIVAIAPTDNPGRKTRDHWEGRKWVPGELAHDGVPHCETCRDMRYVPTNADVGEPGFGCVMPCLDCREHVQRQRAERRFEHLRPRIDQYGIIPRRDCTFDSLVLKGRPSVLNDALCAGREFANSDDQWLVLWGPMGTGKTHLAMAVANDTRARFKTTLLADVPGLLDLLRSGYEHDDYSKIMDLCLNVDYLLLDDVGTEKTTDWGAEKLFQIINNRYNAQRPIMLTMNDRPDVALSPRLASRVMDVQSTIINLVGSDYRKERRNAR